MDSASVRRRHRRAQLLVLHVNSLRCRSAAVLSCVPASDDDDARLVLGYIGAVRAGADAAGNHRQRVIPAPHSDR